MNEGGVLPLLLLLFRVCVHALINLLIISFYAICAAPLQSNRVSVCMHAE
jgi:hypothetical protein